MTSSEFWSLSVTRCSSLAAVAVLGGYPHKAPVRLNNHLRRPYRAVVVVVPTTAGSVLAGTLTMSFSHSVPIGVRIEQRRQPPLFEGIAVDLQLQQPPPLTVGIGVDQPGGLPSNSPLTAITLAVTGA